LANKVANGEVNHEIIFAETTHAKIIAPANKDDKAPSPEQPIVAPKTVIASAPHPEPTLTNPIKPVPKLTQLPKKNAKEKHGKSSLKVAQKTESAPAKKTAEPEMLSPIIAADPLPGEHTLVAAGPSSDELEAQAAAEAAGSGAGTATTANDDTAFSVVDASARQPLAGNPLPTYPQEDRLSGYQGTTVLRGHVTADGQMSDVKIEKSSGSPSLDRASLDAFKNWRFAPGEDAEVRKAITFSLNGETQVVPARLGSR
jgi:protein TonB